ITGLGRLRASTGSLASTHSCPHRADPAHGQGGRDGQALAMHTRTPPLAAPPQPRRRLVPRMPRVRKATQRERKSTVHGGAISGLGERPPRALEGCAAAITGLWATAHAVSASWHVRGPAWAEGMTWVAPGRAGLDRGGGRV